MPTRSYRIRAASEEAAEWYIRCHDNRKLSRSERKKLLAWLKCSPENVAEMLRVCDMDGQFADLKLTDRVDHLQTFDNVVDLISAKYGCEPRKLSAAVRQEKQPKRWLAWAAMLVLSVSMALGFAHFKQSLDGTVETIASQWQHITLEDGSSVHMDARSRIKVEFTAESRIVHVLEGQAVFDVTKDPDRPFIARTKSVDVTAVGTRFGVSVYNGVTATVEEGVVRVTPTGKPDHESAVTLSAGQEFRVLSGGFAAPSKAEVQKVDATRELAWANGWLIFGGGESIGKLVDEFNRRNVKQIRIEDGSIATRKLVGYYRIRIESPDSFARLLDGQEGIDVIKDSSGKLWRLTPE